VTRSSDDLGTDSNEPLGVFIVRAWLHDRSLIARVVHSTDIMGLGSVTVVLVTPEQLRRELTQWLEELGVDPQSEDD
jgi:hypothetical protein